jgi:hypothetical protein
VSVDARALLLDAGWSPARRVDADDADRAWSAEGWSSHAAGRTFLSEYSGLTVRVADEQRRLWFDGVRAVQDWDPAWCRAYRGESGHSLLPAGGYSHMLILVDEDGGLWGGFDAEYGHVADSAADLVQVLLLAPGSKRLDRRVSDDE